MRTRRGSDRPAEAAHRSRIPWSPQPVRESPQRLQRIAGTAQPIERRSRARASLGPPVSSPALGYALDGEGSPTQPADPIVEEGVRRARAALEISQQTESLLRGSETGEPPSAPFTASSQCIRHTDHGPLCSGRAGIPWLF